MYYIALANICLIENHNHKNFKLLIYSFSFLVKQFRKLKKLNIKICAISEDFKYYICNLPTTKTLCILQ